MVYEICKYIDNGLPSWEFKRSSVLIRSFIATGDSKGENVNFHLTYRQCFAQVHITQSTPFHPEKPIVMLEINPILDTTEVSLLIVTQHRGSFCKPGVRIIEVPVSYSLRFVTRSGPGEVLTL